APPAPARAVHAPAPPPPPCAPVRPPPRVAGLFARLPELAEEEVKGAYLTVLGQELERADPLAARIPLTGELDPRLLRVLDRVCQAPAIHLTLTALAADCGASVRTLNRLFLQQLGGSFRQWRGQVVLGRARQLQHRGLTLAQIADRLGYEDPGALSRALQRLARREPTV
uniref:helix-turn-helix transcriptional regulator n=1 Tax=Aeromonas caviae TaxID=648 RepID=UPI0020B151CF